MNIELVISNESLQETALKLIQGFWFCHSHVQQQPEESLMDYQDWTKDGHALYLVKLDDEFIGFAHLGNRGASVDWLEDLFIVPEYQRKGIGSQVIAKLEDIVIQYSESMYMEAAARNLDAIKLYRKLGYDCLNSITIRKDFHPEKFSTVCKERVLGMEFDIRKWK